jgi:hypothetical protein
MNKKTVLIAFLALALGIGGTAAYFYFHSLYVAHTAPPVPPAASAPAQQPAAAQQSAPASQAAPAAQPQNSGVIPPANANNNAAAGTLADNQLVLANISYGAAIDAVRQSYGEPYEIDHEHERQFNGSATVYEYKDTFDLYVVNGIVQRIKVDDLNGLATAQGIKVGSTVDAVVAAYGQPNLTMGDHYIYKTAANPAVGLDFEFEHGFVEKIKCGVLDIH